MNLEPFRSLSSYFWPLLGSSTVKGNNMFLGFEPKRALITREGFSVWPPRGVSFVSLKTLSC